MKEEVGRRVWYLLVVIYLSLLVLLNTLVHTTSMKAPLCEFRILLFHNHWQYIQWKSPAVRSGMPTSMRWISHSPADIQSVAVLILTQSPLDATHDTQINGPDHSTQSTTSQPSQPHSSQTPSSQQAHQSPSSTPHQEASSTSTPKHLSSPTHVP